MRILTIPQPYAQLTVRGARAHDVRPWTATAEEQTGRIAIYSAKNAVPWKELFGEARLDTYLSYYLSEFGWNTREALGALARRAIVGTVSLTRVAAQAEGQWRWEFGDAVEIEPVPLAQGPRRLGLLVDVTASAVAAAEHIARVRLSTPLTPLPGNIVAMRRIELADPRNSLWQKSREWLEDFEARMKVKRNPGGAATTLSLNERRRRELEQQGRFDNPNFEALVQRTLRKYFAGNAVRTVGGQEMVRVDHRQPLMEKLFGDHAWVPVKVFEQTLRWELAGMGWRSESDEVWDDDRRGAFDGLDQFVTVGNSGKARRVVGPEDLLRETRQRRE
jgi:hypothetical protein